MNIHVLVHLNGWDLVAKTRGQVESQTAVLLSHIQSFTSYVLTITEPNGVYDGSSATGVVKDVLRMPVLESAVGAASEVMVCRDNQSASSRAMVSPSP